MNGLRAFRGSSEHALLVDHQSVVGAFRLQGQGFRRDRDRLGGLADLHRDVDAGHVTDIENDLVADILLESRPLRR